MDNRQFRTMQSFEHVLDFLRAHAIKPEPPLLTRMRGQLSETVGRLGQLAGKYAVGGGRMRGKTDVQLRRQAMRREMMALVRIAKPLLKFAPGAESALRVPHARSDTETVARAAVAMATMLAPHAELLEEAGYPTGFFDELRAEAQALVHMTGRSARARNERGRVTADIAEALKEGMRTVTVIEGLVMRSFEGQPLMVRLWKNRRRVSRRIGRPKKR
jgi:hypothetical protein